MDNSEYNISDIFLSILLGIIITLVFGYSFQPKCIIVKSNKLSN